MIEMRKYGGWKVGLARSCPMFEKFSVCNKDLTDLGKKKCI